MANNISTCEVLPITPDQLGQDASPQPYYPMGDYEGYSLAICALPSPELREEIQEVTQKLQKEFPEHNYPPKDYLHMTIASLGMVTTKEEVELAPAKFEHDILSAMTAIEPIEILVEGINDFDKCFFAEVFSNDFFGEDDRLKQLYSQMARVTKEVEQQPYAPHITMGYPSKQDHKLYAHLRQHYATWQFGKDIIDRLYLTALDTKLSLDEQPIKILADYPLTGKEKWAA